MECGGGFHVRHCFGPSQVNRKATTSRPSDQIITVPPLSLGASVKGVIKPHKPSEKGVLIEVLTVDLQFATDDKTGAVTGGSLLLKGQVQAFSLQRDRDFPDNYFQSVNGVLLRKPGGEPWENLGPQLDLDKHTSFFDPVSVGQSTLLCVPARFWGSGGYMLSVLLQQVVDAEKGTSRRFAVALSMDAWKGDITLRPPQHATHIPAVRSEHEKPSFASSKLTV